MLTRRARLRFSPGPSILPALLLVIMAVANTACTAGRATLHSAQLELTYDPQRDRITRFGPAGGPNLLCVRDLDRSPASDGSYTFFGGMYSWISPQKAWVDESGALRDWPPDPAMDRGPATITQHEAHALTAHGPATRSGLVEQKWFQLAPDRAVAMLDQRLHNPTGGNIVGGVWVNTAVKPGAVIAVPISARTQFRVSATEASHALWERATTSLGGWLLIHTDGVQWDDLGADSFKFFVSGLPIVAIWSDGYWLVRQAEASDDEDSLAQHGEAPVEVYINYGLQLFEAELLGPIETIPPGGTIQHIERWIVIPASEPDPSLLRDVEAW